ncbi:MAG: GIY-YIG nuclease family protein [Candidatus Berkelbacteria bacterium]
MNKSSINFSGISSSPGVYKFLDVKGKILYIGKAKNLRNRIRQYFLSTLDRGVGIIQMVELADKVVTVETDSEIEAILLEAELINKIKPKYNIRAKDDKSFLVIKITRRILNSKSQVDRAGSFSMVELVRSRNVDFSDRSAIYFGPYPSGDLLKNALRYLRKIFPYRDCSKTKFASQQRQKRPCIFGEIRVCSAPCADFTDEKDYQKNIGYLVKYLQNKKQKLFADLEKEMAKLSAKSKYEEAALVRDKIRALQHLRDVGVGLSDELVDQSVAGFKRIECYDISNISGKNVVGSMVVFVDGKASKDDYRMFSLQKTENGKQFPVSVIPAEAGIHPAPRNFSEVGKAINGSPTGSGMTKNSESGDDKRVGDIYWMRDVIERRMKNDWPLPDLIVLDGGQSQLNIVKLLLTELGKDIPVVAIAKGAERKRNDLRFSDDKIAVFIKTNQTLQRVLIRARDEAHRFAISYHRKKQVKDLFD